MDQVPCIYYLVQFQKDKNKDVLALIDFGSEVNAMTLAYVAQLGLKVQKPTSVLKKLTASHWQPMAWSLPPFRSLISSVVFGSFKRLFY